MWQKTGTLMRQNWKVIMISYHALKKRGLTVWLTASGMSQINEIPGSKKGTKIGPRREAVRVLSSSLLPLHPHQTFFINFSECNTWNVIQDTHREARMRKLLISTVTFGPRKQHLQTQHFWTLIRKDQSWQNDILQSTVRKKDLDSSW